MERTMLVFVCNLFCKHTNGTDGSRHGNVLLTATVGSVCTSKTGKNCLLRNLKFVEMEHFVVQIKQFANVLVGVV